MLNKIFIMGRLTRDPELRRTQSGTAVTSFSLAVDRDFKSQSGEKETDFIDVVAWRSTAEFVAKYFTKGRMAVVEGRLQIRDWKDREGNNRRSAEVIADNVYFGDSKRDGAPTGGNFSAPPAYRLFRSRGRQLRLCRNRRGGRRPAVLSTPGTPNSIKEEFFHGYGTRK